MLLAIKLISLTFSQIGALIVLFAFVAMIFYFVRDIQLWEVTKICDGDTIKVRKTKRSKEVKVRFIGVDTPESNTLRFGVIEKGGEAAKKYLENILPIGSKVKLETDKQKIDLHGRKLAYVYKGKTMLNALLIRKGYGVFKEYKPNVKHSKLFEELQKKAEKQYKKPTKK